MKIARDDGSRLAQWWYSVDRVELGLVLLLVAGNGLVAMRHASSGLVLGDWWTLLLSRGGATLVALTAVVALSMLSPREMRRSTAVAWLGSLTILLWIATGYGPAGIVTVAGTIAAAAAIVLAAWALAGMEERADVPAATVALVLLAVTAAATVTAGLAIIGGVVLVTWLTMVCFIDIDHRRRIGICSMGTVTVAAIMCLAVVVGGVSTEMIGAATWAGARGGSLYSDAAGAFASDPADRLVMALQLVGLAGVVVRALGAAGRPGPTAIRAAAVGLVLFVSFQGLSQAMVLAGISPSLAPAMDLTGQVALSQVAMAFSMGLLVAATRRHPPTATETLLARRTTGIDRGEAHRGTGRA